MKRLKVRLLSALLALVTVLTLLPTTAFAAVSSGTGIQPTSNPNLWTTRLTSTGQTYSYRPPVAAGKQLYCMDLGYSYRYGTASFLNSYTYRSATGKDADTLWADAAAATGLGEMDAITKENVKWMMTYIVDYQGSIPGSLFMALQTYIWDHQSNKAAGGDSSGDIDAGGFANADTYETYLGYIDWLLRQKAKEDAEYQKKIQEYAAQGIRAAVIEDDNAKWAVYARSSVSGRQAFLAGYFPRKLATSDPPIGGDNPETPAGDADITLKKVSAGTTEPLSGARFLIYRDGQLVGSDVTVNGALQVENVTQGLWSFVETEAPAGYSLDPTPVSVYVDVTNGGKQYTVTAENAKLPDLRIAKRDAQTGGSIPGTVFSVRSLTGDFQTTATTGADGTAVLRGLEAGVYAVRELSVPEPYLVTDTEQTVSLRPGRLAEVTFLDYQKPGLEIIKREMSTGAPLAAVTFQIQQIDGSYETSATTDAHGRIFLEGIPAGTYRITESHVPDHVIRDSIPREVTMKAGMTATITFFNATKPNLEIRKVDSVTGDPIQGAKFRILYRSNHTDSGEQNDLGVFLTDASGKITLAEVKSGWYQVTEVEAAKGYAIREPATQECFLAGGESRVLTFENTPLSALIIRKVDSADGRLLEGAWFRLRYLGGTSGTEGTVIGEYRTGGNGTVVVTGLSAGTYICEEISAPEGYVISDATKTVYLSGKEQDVITVTFGNDRMGSLLIRKKDAVSGAPIPGVEFLLTDSSGSVLGNANGRYVTDDTGSIRVDGLTPGMTVIAREARAKEGYLLDDTPQSIQIKRGATMMLEFRNQPKSGILVKKVDAVTRAPLADVEFLVTDSEGKLIGSANGKYVTDSAGIFTVTDIEPGTTLIVRETQAKKGYVLDDTPQTVKVKASEMVTLEFRNQPKGNLIIEKRDSVTKAPLEGVRFRIIYADGRFVDAEDGALSSNGLYCTDKNGRITLSGIVGTVVVTEVKTIPGYTMDESTSSQTVVVNPGDTQTLFFYNTPAGGLRIVKSDKSTGERIPGVRFEICRMNGESLGIYTTDSDGVIYLPEAEDGWYTVTERKAAAGYLPDSTEHKVEIKAGETATLALTNRRAGSLLLHKIDADTGDGIYGVVFLLCDSGKNPLMRLKTDQDGYAYVEKELPAGKYYLRELEPAEGYLPDRQYKTIYVESGKTATVEWKNTAVTGQIQIRKYAAGNNSITGQPGGTALEGAVFEIIRERSGKVVDYITTDARGVAASRSLPLGRYLIREVTAPAYYQLSAETFDVTLEYAGQIIKLAAYNKPAELGVSVTKTGIREVLAGSKMAYRLSVANTSNVALENFHLHDKLPYDSASASALTTGTYNARLTYRILYRTNYSGYRVLASNLLTTNNYGFSLSAISLMYGEVVTDIYFDFGTVPAGFQCVDRPTLTVSVYPGVANGYRVINRADAGGRYGGTWQTANAAWITLVRRLTPSTGTTLPKTGY